MVMLMRNIVIKIMVMVMMVMAKGNIVMKVMVIIIMVNRITAMMIMTCDADYGVDNH